MNGDEWSIKIFNCSQNFTFARFARKNLNKCSLARAPQIFAFLASSQSKFFISARARKRIAVLSMLANARRDHSSTLVFNCVLLFVALLSDMLGKKKVIFAFNLVYLIRKGLGGRKTQQLS